MQRGLRRWVNPSESGARRPWPRTSQQRFHRAFRQGVRLVATHQSEEVGAHSAARSVAARKVPNTLWPLD
jgi:hypothetical protein